VQTTEGGKVNIAIVGSGRMGSGLGRLWAQKGHRVFFSFSRDPKKLEALAKSNPHCSAGSPAEAVAASEVVLLSVGWAAVEEALRAAGEIRDRIVIDCTNPLKPDLSGLVVGTTTSAGEEIAKLLTRSKVVKAFNTVFAEVYHSETRLFGSRRPTMFFCGDDAGAKATVSKLIIETGFDPIDAGSLASARYLEPMAMLMVQLGRKQGLGTNIALSLIHR
jgi:predicted dinucleotide-binding enzyme